MNVHGGIVVAHIVLLSLLVWYGVVTHESLAQAVTALEEMCREQGYEDWSYRGGCYSISYKGD